MRRIGILWFGLLLSGIAVIAQECPTTELAAVSETRIWCTDIEANEACYGNSIVSAEFASFAPDDVAFRLPGDKVSLSDITTLSTAIERVRYGVSLLRTSGYTPDTWQTQDAMLVLLGDVTLTNTGQEGVTTETITTTITASEGANVRSSASADFRVLTPLFVDDTVKLTGRLEDSSWLRSQLPDGETGWIIADTVDADVSQLLVVDTDAPAPDLLYPPYTAFSLQTQSRDARCQDSWESGVLLQTNSPLRFNINEQMLVVDGTVFLQSFPEVELAIFVIEGTAQHEDVVAEKTEWLRLSLMTGATEQLPPLVESYDFDRVAHLPTEILPRFTYIGIDLSTFITPAPTIDRSPIIDTLVTEPCVLTTGPGGANLRAGPGLEFLVRGVLDFRETAKPIGQAEDSNGTLWWELAQNIWIISDVVVTGGDCASVPPAQSIPNLPPNTCTGELVSILMMT